MDDLERHIAEREKREPGIRQLIRAAEVRQAFMRELAALRRAQGKTQTQIAADMRTSAALVSRLEAGADVQLSTLERYVTALGRELQIKSVVRAKARGRARKPARSSRRASSSR